jgi:hypothetical protein
MSSGQQRRNIGLAVLCVGAAYVYYSRRGAAPTAGGGAAPHTVPLSARVDRDALRRFVAAEEAAKAAAAGSGQRR